MRKMILMGLLILPLAVLVACGGGGGEEAEILCTRSASINNVIIEEPVEVALQDSWNVFPTQTTVYTISCLVPQDMADGEPEAYASLASGTHLMASSESVSEGQAVTLSWNFEMEEPADTSDLKVVDGSKFMSLVSVESVSDETGDFQRVEESITILVYHIDPGPDIVEPVDTDGDGILDIDDNCVKIANPYQGDRDNDGIGNACDPLPTIAYGEPISPDDMVKILADPDFNWKDHTGDPDVEPSTTKTTPGGMNCSGSDERIILIRCKADF